MLEVKNVTKSFNNKKVLDNICFSVKNNSITSYLGSNGSGKTTTFHIIFSLLSCEQGQVLLNNKEINNNDISYLPETRSLYYDITVYEQLALIGKLNNIKNLDYQINDCLNLLSLNQYENTIINKLSKGNQQKVSLACCLLKDASLYILDEPFTGLDNNNVALFTRVILQLKTKGKTIILSSHQYQPINQICDHFIYLEKGKIKYDVDEETLKYDQRRIVEAFNVDESFETPTYVIKEIIREYSNKYLLNEFSHAKQLCNLLIDKSERVSCNHLTINDYIEFNL